MAVVESWRNCTGLPARCTEPGRWCLPAEAGTGTHRSSPPAGRAGPSAQGAPSCLPRGEHWRWAHQCHAFERFHPCNSVCAQSHTTVDQAAGSGGRDVILPHPGNSDGKARRSRCSTGAAKHKLLPRLSASSCTSQSCQRPLAESSRAPVSLRCESLTPSQLTPSLTAHQIRYCCAAAPTPGQVGRV